MPQDVFVIGPHHTHRHAFAELEQSSDVTFHELLAYEEVRWASTYDIAQLLETADRRIAASPATPDAIVTYWDFPSSSLAAILAAEHGLPGMPLRSSLACEHKYWSRVVQRRVVPEVTPGFQAVDPREDIRLADLELVAPFWLKPVKSYGGHLSFRVADEDDLAHAVGELRRRVHRLGEPFNEVLERVSLPEDVRPVDGLWALAEEPIAGHQFTIEGHVHADEIIVHGVFDIFREDDGPTFSHYIYPSGLPGDVVERSRTAAARILRELDYAEDAFNMEFFHDGGSDELKLLEINPRISQEHSELMRYVDGVPNLRVMVDVGLGRAPRLDGGSGPSEVAGKFFVRRRDDAVVAHLPGDDEVEALEERFAPCTIELDVAVGDRLSELEDQETYSYQLAAVYLGRQDETALHESYAQLRDELDIVLEDPEETAGSTRDAGAHGG